MKFVDCENFCIVNRKKKKLSDWNQVARIGWEIQNYCWSFIKKNIKKKKKKKILFLKFEKICFHLLSLLPDLHSPLSLFYQFCILFPSPLSTRFPSLSLLLDLHPLPPLFLSATRFAFLSLSLFYQICVPLSDTRFLSLLPSHCYQICIPPVTKHLTSRISVAMWSLVVQDNSRKSKQIFLKFIILQVPLCH